MTTTSLKLPREIKQLAVAEAKRQGMSPHAFIVDAINLAVLAAEKRAVIVADAVAARNDNINSSLGHEADEVHAYLRARVQGSTPCPLRSDSPGVQGVSLGRVSSPYRRVRFRCTRSRNA